MRVDEGRDESTLTLPLEVFTTPGCAYCARAKRFFKRHSLPYTERDVSANEAVLREMIARASVATCPQIFVAGKLVGGYDTMLAEYEAGRLEPRLARAGLQMAEVGLGLGLGLGFRVRVRVRARIRARVRLGLGLGLEEPRLARAGLQMAEVG